jgi:hypothetical protein
VNGGLLQTPRASGVCPECRAAEARLDPRRHSAAAASVDRGSARRTRSERRASLTRAESSSAGTQSSYVVVSARFSTLRENGGS